MHEIAQNRSHNTSWNSRNSHVDIIKSWDFPPIVIEVAIRKTEVS